MVVSNQHQHNHWRHFFKIRVVVFFLVFNKTDCVLFFSCVLFPDENENNTVATWCPNWRRRRRHQRRSRQTPVLLILNTTRLFFVFLLLYLRRTGGRKNTLLLPSSPTECLRSEECTTITTTTGYIERYNIKYLNSAPSPPPSLPPLHPISLSHPVTYVEEHLVAESAERTQESLAAHHALNDCYPAHLWNLTGHSLSLSLSLSLSDGRSLLSQLRLGQIYPLALRRK